VEFGFASARFSLDNFTGLVNCCLFQARTIPSFRRGLNVTLTSLKIVEPLCRDRRRRQLNFRTNERYSFSVDQGGNKLPGLERQAAELERQELMQETIVCDVPSILEEPLRFTSPANFFHQGRHQAPCLAAQ
jgi:hypothetical protein